MVTGSDQGERDGHPYVEKNGKCHTGSVLGGMNTRGLEVDNNGPDTIGYMRVHINRAG